MTKDEALKLALEALEMFCEHGAILRPIETRDAIKEALANEALEKMAENARELGLDYEPAQRTWVGLTDGEVDKMILLMGFPPDWITENAIIKNIVCNLEAKLKEKNT
jgi:hypothetical protein